MIMIKVISAIGLHTIQDAGRTGYRAYGVPVGGVMDNFAFETANLLLGNEKNTPALEISIGKIVIWFETEMLITVTGFAIAKLNGNKVPSWRPILIAEGDILEIQAHPLGNFAYLSVQGKWMVDSWLGSASTYLPVQKGGLNGQPIQTGDVLEIEPAANHLTRNFTSYLKKEKLRYASWGIAPNLFPGYLSGKISIIHGPEKDFFSDNSIIDFTQKEFNISNDMNRMAILVKEIPLERKNSQELLSVAVQKGTVQVTPDRTLYLLMSDAQTTGGYPRIGQVTAVDLPVCAQLRPSRKLRWEWVSVNEARNLLLKKHRQLQSLQAALQRKYLSYTDVIAV